MPLEPTELKDEALVQLRQLERSPGWALWQTRLHALSRHSEVRKATALRANNINEALRLQGEVDGLRQAADGITRYMQQLKVGDTALPSNLEVALED